MLKKRVIRDEDPETGDVQGITIRYDADWRGVLLETSKVLLKIGDETLVKKNIKVPKGKAVHLRITIAGLQADIEPKNVPPVS